MRRGAVRVMFPSSSEHKRRAFLSLRQPIRHSARMTAGWWCMPRCSTRTVFELSRSMKAKKGVSLCSFSVCPPLVVLQSF